jgi:serine/threonine protein phosphatase PrpC
MAIYAGAATDKGPKRAQNEDSYALVHTHRAFAVADGSGGPGATIANAALHAFVELYQASPAPAASSMPLRHDELFAGAGDA